MQYTCSRQSDFYTTTWDGNVEVLDAYNNSFECRISGRGSSFHAIIGSYMNGHFLCIPDMEFGCPLAGDPCDVLWNLSLLMEYLPEVDAITIANGISTLYKSAHCA
ncbi:MAG: hypothetical protein J6D57_00320 [Mogibacterium sp.]|nr:hypothetical protein [Mogibacterium sp.]